MLFVRHLKRIFANITYALNPFNYFRLEREKDREVVREVARELGDALRAQNEVALRSLAIMDKFLDSFKSEGEPESRVLRSEDEVKAFAERYGMKPEDIVEENPFSVIY